MKLRLKFLLAHSIECNLESLKQIKVGFKLESNLLTQGQYEKS